jgi:beta-1,4-N-acetylglucosaminyltransferase
MAYLPEPQFPAGKSDLVPRRGTLVTVGRSTKYRFTRLVDTVLEVLPMLPQPVFIQHAGLPPESLRGLTGVDMLSHDAFHQRMRSAELLISHAGAGTILEALRAGIPAVVMARRPELGEIADGHQLELAETLSRLGLVEAVTDAPALRSILGTMERRRRPLGDPLNQRQLVERVRIDIASLLRRGVRPRIALVASSGGHMTELLELRAAYEGIPHFYVASDRLPSGGPGESIHVFPSADRDWRVVRNVPAILRMLLKERPGIVLSTGSSSAVPVIVLARLMGARVIYVESLTRVLHPSLTARVVYPVSDSFIVRWPDVARPFRRALVMAAGPIPADEAPAREIGTAPPPFGHRGGA